MVLSRRTTIRDFTRRCGYRAEKSVRSCKYVHASQQSHRLLRRPLVGLSGDDRACRQYFARQGRSRKGWTKSMVGATTKSARYGYERVRMNVFPIPVAYYVIVHDLITIFVFPYSVDHPHGGGRGKSKGNKHPRSPWGWLTKGAS